MPWLVRSPTITVAVAAVAILAAACSGSPTVAEVNGQEITAAEVNALSADPPDDVVIAGDPFRADLDLLIVNVALMSAAEEQFGFEDLDDPDRIAGRIATPPPPEQQIFANIAADPSLSDTYAEAASAYFTIREAVIDELATEDDLDDAAKGELFGRWADEAVSAAEVVIRSQVGIWGGTGLGVLPPPAPQ